MKLTKNSKAEKAYQRGIKDNQSGKSIDETPYITGKVIALNAWYQKGWIESNAPKINSQS